MTASSQEGIRRERQSAGFIAEEGNPEWLYSGCSSQFGKSREGDDVNVHTTGSVKKVSGTTQLNVALDGRCLHERGKSGHRV